MLPLVSILLALVVSLPISLATPTLVYALQDQLPPVARVGKEFVFDIYPTSFNSTSTITYTTSTLPTWLTFSSPFITFYGTPALTDIGSTTVTLTATDASGSVASSFVLLVTNYSVPAVHQSFQTQLASASLHAFSSASVLPGKTGVSITPYWSFSLGFQYDTFRISYEEPEDGDLYFAAHQRGMAGLPNWLEFNNETFTFTGVAPGEGSYTIVATGSDEWGYTGAQTSFVIEVGVGEGIEIAAGQNLTGVLTMSTTQVSHQISLDNVLLGGEKVTDSEVTLDADTSSYPWLSFDSATRTLSGTTPDDFQNGTIASLSLPISISSTNTSNTLHLDTWLSLDVLPYFFSTFNLPNATATPSQAFSFDLSQYLTNKTATVNATVSPTDAASWLTFDSSNLTLVGTPPKSPAYNDVKVLFQASSGGISATTGLSVTLAGVTASSTGSATAAVPLSTNGGSSSHSGLSDGAKIGLGVGLGLLALLLLLLLLLFCCLRRKKHSKPRGEKEKDDDADSFVAGSPTPDPFRRSGSLNPLGEIPKFSAFNLRSSHDGGSVRPVSAGTDATFAVGQPTRLDAMKGIFGWGGGGDNEKKSLELEPALVNGSGSFLGSGDVIGVNDPVNRPSQDASSFTNTFGSSESSRASWESRRSFRWSSAENEGGGDGETNRLSVAPSIPRPRQDFTPRYPRNGSPTAIARLTSAPSEDGSHASFSEFHSSHEGHDSFSGTGSVPGSESMGGSFSGSTSGSSFPAGPSGLGRFVDSGGFRSIDEAEEDEDGFSVEGPAVVALAERQSFETRRGAEAHPVPRLRPSRERVGFSPVESEPGTQQRTPSQTAYPDAFEDADEQRRSTIYAPSDAGVQGLGYPSSAIYFGSPSAQTDRGYISERSSHVPSEARSSTIRAVPTYDNPLSPPLPQVGSFMRHRRTATGGSGNNHASSRPGSGIQDGRIIACANETFSTHPTIHPPPTVSLSAATWSSGPPSTYRAVGENGAPLPQWLHFDARELELWGVPALRHAGETIVVRIIEKMGNGNRRSDPTQFGYEPPQEREVGRIVIEWVAVLSPSPPITDDDCFSRVVDRLKSPQFALEDVAHAL
ncbi:axial budding pattern protein 2, partial [Tremellales sp. Uapishka_1]